MPVRAQGDHAHTPAVSGVPLGVPYFCSRPTATSKASGLWSEPETWSSRKVPGANDKVVIAEGHVVTFNVLSDLTNARLH
jgi:hypothetical protein